MSGEELGGRLAVSATESVSLRSLRSVATSFTISRSSCGGKEDVDIVEIVAGVDLELVMIELVKRTRRRYAETL